MVDFCDSKLDPNATTNCVINACQNDFALVGTSANALEDPSDIDGCKDAAGKAIGIPDLAAFAFLPLACDPDTYLIGGYGPYCATAKENPQTYTANVGDARRADEYHAGNPAGRTQYGQDGGDWPPELTELMPGLGADPDDLRITKRGWGAFARTDLDARLRSLGVTQVVIAGVATSYGIESTARGAYDRGYHVTIAADAVTDPTPEGHQHRLDRVFPALGQVGTTAEIIALLPAPGDTDQA